MRRLAHIVIFGKLYVIITGEKDNLRTNSCSSAVAFAYNLALIPEFRVMIYGIKSTLIKQCWCIKETFRTSRCSRVHTYALQ